MHQAHRRQGSENSAVLPSLSGSFNVATFRHANPRNLGGDFAKAVGYGGAGMQGRGMRVVLPPPTSLRENIKGIPQL
jgi:hypothetical protein